MRWISSLVCSVALVVSAASAAAQAAPAKAAPQAATPIMLPPSPRALLPDAFAGWVADDPPKALTDPAQADPANAVVLKEYEFISGAANSYKRDGETLSIHAIRFQDASGAYGAYTFYRQNGWPKEDIGTGATSNHNRVLFWKGNTVVDTTFSHIGPMSGSELRELAAKLPVPSGSRALMPPILGSLPQPHLDGQTAHYAVGPLGYAGSGGVLPVEVVGFDRGAESVTANYTLTSGPATLTIIDYPTPQISAAQETRIRDYIKAGSQAQPPRPKPLVDSDQASLEVRRSGPLVILISGDATPEESHKLLECAVNDHEKRDDKQRKDCPVRKRALDHKLRAFSGIEQQLAPLPLICVSKLVVGVYPVRAVDWLRENAFERLRRLGALEKLA